MLALQSIKRKISKNFFIVFQIEVLCKNLERCNRMGFLEITLRIQMFLKHSMMNLRHYFMGVFLLAYVHHC